MRDRPVGLPRWSVRARILAAIMLVAVVGLGVTGTVTYLVQRERVHGDIDVELERQVDAARSVVAEGSDIETSRGALAAILAVVLPPRNGSALGIVNGRPALVPGTEVAFALDDTSLPQRVVLEVADGTVRRGTAVIDGRELRYVAVPVNVGETDEGIYLVAIDVSLELQTIDRLLGVFAVVAGGTLVAVGIAGWLVAGRLLRPIRQLRRTTERITDADLSERIPVDGHDDVSRLTETVNAMLDRLEVAMRNQRELLDDVRHELRTPLTVVRGHLELVHADDRDDVQRTRELVIDELDRMGALVDGLATLAEVRAAAPSLAPVDVARLTRDVVALASGIATHRWEADEVAAGEMALDRRLIVQAWLQLADNAAKYSPPGSVIELGSEWRDRNLELWVRDRGPGIPEAHRTRIFERFARIPGASTSGSGLGLAIVAGIALAHRGSVRVESPGDGARFVISIPREDQP